MKSYSLTDLSNKSGEIADAAFREPVAITKRGKRKFVLLAADHYERLIERSARRAVHVDDLTDDDAARYIAALSGPLDGDDD